LLKILREKKERREGRREQKGGGKEAFPLSSVRK
jgi:hypothetical protein